MVSHSLPAGLRRSGARWASPADGTAMAQAKTASQTKCAQTWCAQTWCAQNWRIDGPPRDPGRSAGLLAGWAQPAVVIGCGETMPQPEGIENVAMSHLMAQPRHCCTPLQTLGSWHDGPA